MNYLSLSQRTRQLCGIQGDGPSAVTGQSGIYSVVVNEVAQAYQEIQSLSDKWNYMWSRFEFTTTADYRDYDKDNTAIDRIAADTVTCYVTGSEDEEWRLEVLPYLEFRRRFELGEHAAGEPRYLTVLPSGTLRLHPTPDLSTYKIQGDYYRLPDTLSANTDTPILPEKFHMAIAYKAMIGMGAYLGAQDVTQRGERNFYMMLKDMYRDELPDVVFAVKPLA